jgi:ethanolamine transporter EutH
MSRKIRVRTPWPPGRRLRHGYESLGGTTIDSVQLVALAPLLARHLGITVAD